MSSLPVLPVLPEGHIYWVAGASNLIVAHDWREWLAANGGGTIVSSAWSTPDPEMAVDAVGTPNVPADGWTITRVSGGNAGNRAKLVEQITTSDDQQPKATIHLHVLAHWPPE
jgi:hypothetical protein